MRMAVMGAGSLGTIVGALITKGGLEIDLIDVNTAHVNALKERGAKITGKMELEVPVKALTPDEMVGEYDLFFYLVKATHNGEALPKVAQHLKSDGVVVTMQNGIPEESVAAVVGRERTLGCAVGWGAALVAPGVSMLASDLERMTYDIGELDGQITDRLKKIIEILKLAGKPEATTNLIGVRWTKLTANVTFSGMSTVIGGTYGDVLDNPKALLCAAHIGRESLAVARAADITPELIQGFDIRYLDFHTQKQLEQILPIYGIIFGPHRAVKASMLLDLEKGLPCEIDAINGAVWNWARRFNVSTPVNDQVVDIIKKIQSGELKPEPANLDRIDVPQLPAK